jgi:hypothetical protein
VSDELEFRRLVRALKRTGLRLPEIEQRPRPQLPAREHPRHVATLPVRMPAKSLAAALRPRGGAVRWETACRRCGVRWRGVVQDVGHEANVLATLAVLRVPCPVCWALAWRGLDHATRDAWAAVDSWIVPRWR